MKYLAIIKYLGTDFHGFQVQPNSRTVQGTLTGAAKSCLGCAVKITGCSRTDSGVHANEFCVTLEADSISVPADKLPVAMQRFLPKDLAVISAEPCDDDFHPRYSIKSKEYLYRIKNNRIYDPFEVGRVWFVPQNIDDESFAKMRSAAEFIPGYRDFASFMAADSGIEDTRRTVHYLSVDRKDDFIEIRICADGFLYNMVRIIVGTLIDVAFGRIDPSSMPEIISSRDRSRAGTTAPADGLYLNKVNY